METYINEDDTLEVEDVINIALSATSQYLTFTMQQNQNNPNQLINTETAHCVGYSSFYTTACNYLLNKHNISDTWTAKHHIGRLYIFGYNIHQYVDNPFF